jgi:hypothetical protein
MFTVTVIKRFNLALYSYLVGIQVKATAGDPKIFVVKQFRVAPTSSSSMSMSSGSGSMESISSSSQPSSQSSSSSSIPMESSSSAFPDLFPDSCELELYTVASLADLQLLPGFPISDGLFRTDTIAVAFKTQAQLDTFMEAIMEDIRTNALLQQIPLSDFEVREFEETVVDDPNPNDPFIF